MGTHRRILNPAHQKTGVISVWFPSIQLFRNTLSDGVAKGSGHGI